MSASDRGVQLSATDSLLVCHLARQDNSAPVCQVAHLMGPFYEMHHSLVSSFKNLTEQAQVVLLNRAQVLQHRRKQQLGEGQHQKLPAQSTR